MSMCEWALQEAINLHSRPGSAPAHVIFRDFIRDAALAKDVPLTVAAIWATEPYYDQGEMVPRLILEQVEQLERRELEAG